MWYYDNWNWTKIDNQELNEIIKKKMLARKDLLDGFIVFGPFIIVQILSRKRVRSAF